MTIFPQTSRDFFAANYPETAHKLEHNLHEHDLLSLERLARLAESLPERLIECNTGDLPFGVEERPEQLIQGVGDRIRNIDSAGCWVGLREVNHDPEYAQLLEDMLDDIRPQITATTGEIMNVQGFIFVTSPGGVTPFHFDPEHNILFQVRGSKIFSHFQAGDPRFASDEHHERYHSGGPAELPFRDTMMEGVNEFHLAPGEALHVPVMAPHFVRNGPEVSISLSVTWRSEWTYAEADARGFNRLTRKLGMTPKAPGRWPKQNRGKAYAYRALRKTGLVA